MTSQASKQATGSAREALVVGAGPAGLATAAMLRERGIAVSVLEQGDAVGTSWHRRYEGLRLNTVRWLSSLPGLRVPRAEGRWVSRDSYVGYLERYASFHALEVELEVEALRVEREDGGWTVTTSAGRRRTRHLVIATGFYRKPRLPDWPGRQGFEGRAIHAAEYRSAGAFAGEDVLVVGGGNTGAEIAQQLAGVARRVRLSIRTPPNIVPRELMGLPTHPLSLLARRAPPWILDRSTRLGARLSYGDLAPHGLPLPPEGVHTTSLRMRPPVIDAGFVDLVKRGRIEVVAPVTALSAEGVRLADETVLAPDSVIAATGYDTGLDELVGHLGVLDREGRPLRNSPEIHPSAPDLYFVGFRPKLGGFLVDFRFEARRTARAVGERLRH